MNERQRQDYLEAMGIQPWFPRFALPGAKASVACNWDYDDAQVITEQSQIQSAQPVAPLIPAQPQAWSQPSSHQQTPQQQSPQQNHVARPASGSLKESSNILDELGFATPETKKDKKQASETKAEVTEVILAEPFRLAVIDVSESCLVVSDIPWSGLNQFTGYHQRLLTNILRALKIPSDQEWSQNLFVWPMIPDSSPIDQKYAQEAVHGFLNNQFGLKRRKNILLFGQTSCRYLWSLQEPFEKCRGIHEREGMRYGITRSLGEMMGIPELKAEAWANLKDLVKA